MIEAFLPPGYALAPARRDDAVELLALVTAHHAATGGTELSSLAEIVADLEYPDIDLERDTWVVRGSAGRVVAYGIAYLDVPGRSFVDLYLDPALDRAVTDELGRGIVRAGVRRAGEDAVARGLSRSLVESGMLRADVRQAELLAGEGFTLARTWWRMRVDLAPLGSTDSAARSPVAPDPAVSESVVSESVVPDPAASESVVSDPVAPAGVVIDQVDGDDDEVIGTAHALHNAAFAEHYGHVPRDLDGFITEVRHAAGYDPSAFWFARDASSGEAVGLAIGTDVRVEAGAGFVDTLGVLAEHRGRGIARALLRTVFDAYARRGRTSVGLDVDSANGTGAVALYESVGMRPVEVIDTWELPLTLTRPPHASP